MHTLPALCSHLSRLHARAAECVVSPETVTAHSALSLPPAAGSCLCTHFPLDGGVRPWGAPQGGRSGATAWSAWSGSTASVRNTADAPQSVSQLPGAPYPRHHVDWSHCRPHWFFCGFHALAPPSPGHSESRPQPGPSALPFFLRNLTLTSSGAPCTQPQDLGFFPFSVCACRMRNLPGQRLNLSHHRDNARSLTL